MIMSFRGLCFYSSDWTSVLRLYLYLLVPLYCILKTDGNVMPPTYLGTYDS